MKRIFLISILLGFGILSAFSQDSIVSIPDTAFLHALIEDGVDTNEDGRISLQEAEIVNNLSIEGKEITDPTGIEAFVNIDTFDCSWNPLNSLDVSNNIALKYLVCHSCQLTSLDISYNSALTNLICYRNQLTSLDVSMNSALTELACSFNQLTSLDVSMNSALTKLTCDGNQLSSLNVTGCKKLEYINCGCARCVEWGADETNQLTSLDLSNNTKLISIDLSGMASLGEVCVWEGFDDSIAEIVESLNVYFTTECYYHDDSIVFIPDTTAILPCSDPFSVSGTTEVVSIHGSGLESNLLGDSPDRAASIYLPPGYESSPENRYPVLYFLHGYTSTHLTFFGGSSGLLDRDFSKIMDKLINSGAVPPVIIVSPNVNNKYGGCFYTNSYVTGQWEDFISRDVIDFVESNYRVIPERESRGIAGHSMGGYGTITLAMKHPELFSAAYTLSAALMDLEQYVFGQEIKEEKYLEEALNGKRFEDLSFYARTYVAIAAAFAPDSTASPFLGQLPLDTSGAIIDSVWQKWLDHDPSMMISTLKDNLLEYTAIQMDCGTSDEYYFYTHNESFSDSLTRYGIEHVFEGYEGDHVNQLENRMETRLLPFFFENLEHEVPGIIRTGAWNLKPSDSLVLELDLDGTAFIVPEATEAVLDSILEKQILAVTATSKTKVKIPLADFNYGSYVAYGMNETQTGISLPVAFSVVPYIPEITIHLTDFSTNDPLAEVEMNINGSTYLTDSLGEVVLKGCGPINSYALSITRVADYAPLEENMVVYSDTTFEFSLVRDSYLKIVDRATEQPIQGAIVKFEGLSFFTNKDGVVTIQDLRSEDLSYRVEHTYYFPLMDTSVMSSGDTLVVELSKLLASIEFQVSDETGLVTNQDVEMGGRTVKTNDEGIARFAVNQARQFYHYNIVRSCYSQVNDSLFLEVDTTVSVALHPVTTLPEINTRYLGDTLEINSSSSGSLYVVPAGTERLSDSIKSDPLFVLPVLMDDPVQVNISELPAGEYWVYFIDQCEYVSEELTASVGLDEVHAGDFNIYPNPVDSELLISYSGYGNYVVEITGLNGVRCYRQEYRGPVHRIDLTSLQKGVYFITIRSKDFVTTRKVIKL